MSASGSLLAEFEAYAKIVLDGRDDEEKGVAFAAFFAGAIVILQTFRTLDVSITPASFDALKRLYIETDLFAEAMKARAATAEKGSPQ